MESFTIAIVAVILVIVFAGAVYMIMKYYVNTSRTNTLPSIPDKSQLAAAGTAGLLGPISTDSALGNKSDNTIGQSPTAPGSGAISNLLNSLEQSPEVFNISENVYRYEDAKAVCGAFGAQLATLDQMLNAYKNGADWCNQGWIQGQMAVFPTQRTTWEKLQSGAPDQRNNCGLPGLNGGRFDNPNLRFGVNCYGIRPPQRARDRDDVLVPTRTTEAIEFDKKVAAYKAELSEIGILPYQPGSWAK